MPARIARRFIILAIIFLVFVMSRRMGIGLGCSAIGFRNAALAGERCSAIRDWERFPVYIRSLIDEAFSINRDNRGINVYAAITIDQPFFIIVYVSIISVYRRITIDDNPGINVYAGIIIDYPRIIAVYAAIMIVYIKYINRERAHMDVSGKIIDW